MTEHRDCFEAGSELHAGDFKANAIISIAMSLKRIADSIDGTAYDYTPGADNSHHRMGLVDGVMHAIEQGIIIAAQRGGNDQHRQAETQSSSAQKDLSAQRALRC